MKTYKTIKTVNIAAGRLKLSADQARRRKHLIKKVDGEDNVYDIISPCQFKAGEEIGYEGEPLNAALASCFEGEQEARVEARAERKAAEKAAADKESLPDADAPGNEHAEGSVVTKTVKGIGDFFAGLFGKDAPDALDDTEKAFQALVEAIGEINPEDKDKWTGQSGPILGALKEASGRDDLTVENRDAAWRTWLELQEKLKQAD